METLKLKDFQVEGVDFLMKHHYSILGDEMGLGKTIQALEIAKVSKSVSTVVICPSSLKFNWENEIKEKFPQLKSSITITTYSQLKHSSNIFRASDIVIADEAHYLKNLDAQRTKLFHNYIDTFRPKRLLLLTGTPLKNRVPEFYSLILLCSYGIERNNGIDITQYFKSYYDFAGHFCYTKKFKIKGREITKYEGYRNVKNLQKLLKYKYLRRTSDLLNLPPLTRIPYYISDFTYQLDLESAWEDFNNGKITSHISQIKLVNALSKVKATLDITMEILNTSNQVVIFTDHLASLAKISEILNKKEISNQIISGQVSMEKRAQIIEGFQNKKFSVLAATIGSASVGLNLQKNCNYMVFNDFPWVPGDLSQAEKRIHRMGQDKPCFLYYVFSGGIDKFIYDTIEKKNKTLKAIL